MSGRYRPLNGKKLTFKLILQLGDVLADSLLTQIKPLGGIRKVQCIRQCEERFDHQIVNQKIHLIYTIFINQVYLSREVLPLFQV